MKRNLSVAALVVLLLVLTTSPAYAYLDPASGSMILQVIVAAVAAALIAVKAFWHRIRGLFGTRKIEAVESTEDKS